MNRHSTQNKNALFRPGLHFGLVGILLLVSYFANGECKVSIKEGTAISICAGTSKQLNAEASGFTDVSKVTYAWTPETGLSDPKIPNPLANPAITTTYTVTATDGTCTPVPTAKVIVTVNPLPLANAGTNSVICAGSPITLGTATVLGSTYSWTAAPLDNTLDANKTKSVTLQKIRR